MPPKRSFRRKKRGLSTSFIVMGVLSLLYSGFFPLFRIFDYALLAVLMIVAGNFVRAFARKMHQKEDEALEKEFLEELKREEERLAQEKKEREEAEKRERERARATTGDPAVDEMILRGQQLLQQVRGENDRLPDPEISEQIDTVEAIANQIFNAVIDQPKKAQQIRRFMDYYLPTTLKMLTAYRRMEEGNVSSEAADDARERIRNSLNLVIEAFTKQLNKLYEDDALDINTDIDVMETMLRQDGLIDSGFKVRTSSGEEK